MTDTSRVKIDPARLTPAQNYFFLISAIVPRPIAWISTRSPEGSTNLAPFSFFQGVAADPPTLMVSIARTKKSGETKDTLANIQATGEFVVNMVPGELAGPMEASADELPAGESEIDRAGLATFSAERVSAPCLADSPVNLECRLSREVAIGSCVAVFGEVLLAHVREDLLDERGTIDPDRLAPLARLGGSLYLPYGKAIRLRPASGSR
ncbi:MAG: flavin reductase family protein [Acidobacteriota bacterium]|nr:flavin reductase family protein [Acidobacteriota bacterium]